MDEFYDPYISKWWDQRDQSDENIPHNIFDTSTIMNTPLMV